MAKKIHFQNPREKINKATDEKANKPTFQTAEAQLVYDNIKFGQEAISNPVMTDKYNKKVFGFEMINFTPYLNHIIWPRGIYVTDKLIRLGVSATLELQKKYLAKKRKMPSLLLWFLVIVIFIIIGVIILVVLLPRLGGAI